ncbi:MAG: pyridoxamine 5'-phosphate oxidase [Chloroflexi bacterium HGW-Chloroflexi-4]|nr:MAG: pyridoxamine 5'-phosphate oxidase [Chloroflexi bacterium HGW-Chloroflexi-4]
MAKFYDSINDQIKEFIQHQHIFFVGSAPLSASGHVNVSPKGLDSFRVLSPNRVAYMDIISSGNETSAHTLENGRITFMFCSFEGAPNILRLFGTGRTVLKGDADWQELAKYFNLISSTRQIIVAEISKVQTSCGYGVPLYEFKGDRDQHFKWAEKIGPDGLVTYRNENNLISVDGLPTPLGNSLDEQSKVGAKRAAPNRMP